jgi:hypothetical protein
MEHSTPTTSEADLPCYLEPNEKPRVSHLARGFCVLAMRLPGGQRYPHLGAVGPADGLGDPGAGGGQGVEVDAGLDAEAVEQVDHVLACHVTGGVLVAEESGQPPISGWPAPPPPWSGWACRWPE